MRGCVAARSTSRRKARLAHVNGAPEAPFGAPVSHSKRIGLVRSDLMDAPRITQFAAAFDPQPFHLDEAAAKASVFQGLAGSGWRNAAVAMRLLATSGLRFSNRILGLGATVSCPRLTGPGDILHMNTELVEITPSKSSAARGIVTIRSTMLNQNGETV